MFALLDGMILRGLPFDDADRLVHVEYSRPADGIESMEVPAPDFERWRERQESFEGLAGYLSGDVNLADVNLADVAAPAERYRGTRISTGFLDLVGERPALGRGFEPADAAPDAPRAVLLAHHVWRTRYGGDPAILGRQIRIDAELTVVVGVLPKGFGFPFREDVWLPLRTEGLDAEARLDVFGRLHEDRTIEEARAELAVLTEQLAQASPETHEGVVAVVKPFTDEFVNAESRALLGAMFGAVVLVLLVACFNVANLLVGRAALRRRDFAIQAALGAKGRHAAAGLVVESLLLALPGALLGLGLAHLGVSAFDRLIRRVEMPFWMDFYLSPKVLLVAAGAAILAALVAALVPALQASRAGVGDVLADAGRGNTGFRIGRISRAMVVTQLAVSAALCIGAGLAVRSAFEAQGFDHAFEPEQLLTARLSLTERQGTTDAERAAFLSSLEAHLAERSRAEGLAEQLALGSVLPAETQVGAAATVRFERQGDTYETPRQMPFTRWIAASPSYFDTLGMTVLAGRGFTDADRSDASPVVVVNESFARREWPRESPIGQVVDLWLGTEAEADNAAAGRAEVVGVVADVRLAGFDADQSQHAVYLPLAQQPTNAVWIVARSRGEPSELAAPLRRAVLEFDPDLPLYHVRTMVAVLDESLFMPRFLGTLFLAFGAAALLLASVGLYGLMAFAVSQRQREMGVRMALGATAGDVRRLLLRRGLAQTTIGLAFGLLAGRGLGAVLSTALFQVSASDLATFVAVPALLAIVAVLACWVPARRASSLDPVKALSTD
jgi:predicted permease